MVTYCTTLNFFFIELGKKRKAFLDCLIEMAENNPGSLSDKDILEEVDTFMFEVSLCTAYTRTIMT